MCVMSQPVGTKATNRWRSAKNWLNGLRFEPEERWMCCGQDVPDHYNGCAYVDVSVRARVISPAPGDAFQAGRHAVLEAAVDSETSTVVDLRERSVEAAALRHHA